MKQNYWKIYGNILPVLETKIDLTRQEVLTKLKNQRKIISVNTPSMKLTRKSSQRHN